MGCYQCRGLGGHIYDLWQCFGSIYQEQESWFLCVSTKPAQCADASSMMGLKPASPKLQCSHEGDISLVAREKEARSEAGGSHRC